MSYIQGIDISHHDDVDCTKLPANVQFVYCKATEGATYQDPAFNGYWQQLKSTTIYRGAYHFLDVGATAQQQADNFLSRGADFSKPNVLPPVLDVEDQVPSSNNAQIVQDKPAFIQLIKDWIDIIQKETGRKVMIYSYKNFFNEYLNNTSWPGSYLWLAAYQANPPGLPVGYQNWNFWQYSQYGTLAGATTGGSLDLDYFNGTVADLAAL